MIGKKIQFDTEKEQGIVPFEYLGIVKDYNGVDVLQCKHFIQMSCGNYLRRLLKSHGWDTDSSKPLPTEAIPFSVRDDESSSINVHENESSSINNNNNNNNDVHTRVCEKFDKIPHNEAVQKEVKIAYEDTAQKKTFCKITIEQYELSSKFERGHFRYDRPK